MRPGIGQITADDFIYRVPSEKWFIDFSCIAISYGGGDMGCCLQPLDHYCQEIRTITN